jgi:hypothetical protein
VILGASGALEQTTVVLYQAEKSEKVDEAVSIMDRLHDLLVEAVGAAEDDDDDDDDDDEEEGDE